MTKITGATDREGEKGRDSLAHSSSLHELLLILRNIETLPYCMSDGVGEFPAKETGTFVVVGRVIVTTGHSTPLNNALRRLMKVGT